MNSKKSQLPILQNHKKKTIAQRDRTKIEDLLLKNRHTHKQYPQSHQFTQTKASNFLSRIDTVDTPAIVLAVADQVKQLHSTFGKENMTSRGDIISNNSSLQQAETRLMGEERQQAVILAKWMDEKLVKFKAKQIVTFMDILEYKQTILNYALGRIIDSLTKKCREEGQLLSLIWNNTFSMFEGVFNVLVDANKDKQNQNIKDTQELQQIYEVNHNFLREQNTALQQENQAIFQKMKNVIVWNKKLRKERKQLSTSNRILEYRNHTYSQALQQTVQMLLRTVPEPATIHTAKKIVKKLTKEKHRKKNYLKQQIDQEFNTSTKEFVFQWLKRNTSLNQDIASFLNQTPWTKEDRFILEDIDDWNQMKKVNIYDFFKLYDVSVQTTVSTNSQACQSELVAMKNVEVMTKAVSITDHGCQTVARHESKPNIEAQTKQIQRNAQKGTRSRLKHGEKSIKKIKDRDLVSNKSLRNLKKMTYFQEQHNNQIHRYAQRSSGQVYKHNDKYQVQSRNIKDQTTSMIRKIQNNAVAFRINPNSRDSRNISASSNSDLEDDGFHTRGTTTRHLITNNSLNSRLKSMREISEQYGSNKLLVGVGGLRKKYKKQSVAYIGEKFNSKSISKLNLHKNFNETYNENRALMNSNREQFYDQIIRRRSFYGKKKVQFANLKAAEEANYKSKQFLRGKPVPNHFKTFFEESNYLSRNIQKITKKMQGPSNIAKTKTLLSSQTVFSSIINNIQQKARIPLNNKTFIANSLQMISRHIQSLIPDYLRQTRRQKQELICDYEKALYPLSVLLMEQMTFKYGLKEIAGRKIKGFIEKVLTFASVSQKISLYSLLLGLQDPEVGSDQLLIYIKSLVYFDGRKAIKESAISTESTPADVEVVRQNLRKVLSYFFDTQYVNLIELKLEIYFQQTAPFSTIEGIAILIIRQLLKRKRQIKQKYEKIHRICSVGDNFFTNIYKMIKIVANYSRVAELQADKNRDYSSYWSSRRDSTDSIDVLQRMKGRKKKNKKKIQIRKEKEIYSTQKISKIIHELLQRSDIIDQEFGKSITIERFITIAVISGIPTYSELETTFQYFKIKFNELQQNNPAYASYDLNNHRSLEKLANYWSIESVQKQQEPVENLWTLSRVYSERVQEEVLKVMGKTGTIGLYLQSAMVGLNSLG